MGLEKISGRALINCLNPPLNLDPLIPATIPKSVGFVFFCSWTNPVRASSCNHFHDDPTRIPKDPIRISLKSHKDPKESPTQDFERISERSSVESLKIPLESPENPTRITKNPSERDLWTILHWIPKDPIRLYWKSHKDPKESPTQDYKRISEQSSIESPKIPQKDPKNPQPNTPTILHRLCKDPKQSQTIPHDPKQNKKKTHWNLPPSLKIAAIITIKR